MRFPKLIYDIPYADEYQFQTLDVCLPRRLEDSSKEAIWIVFLHGGAWRDVKQDKIEIRPALKQLLARYGDDPESSALRNVAGIASINYRLSGHPEDPSRGAVHPDHVHDVLLALRWLEKEYDVGSGRPYMAVGHSCGATMAFQVAMDRQWERAIPREAQLLVEPLKMTSRPSTIGGVKPPVAIVGLGGLYDLPLLVETHQDQPFYRKFITEAWGKDEEIWAKASPVAGAFSKTWPDAHLVVIAQSTEDQNVDWPQVKAMAKALEDQGWTRASHGSAEGPSPSESSHKKHLLIHHLTGKHDDVWERGTELCSTIELALGSLFQSKEAK